MQISNSAYADFESLTNVALTSRSAHYAFYLMATSAAYSEVIDPPVPKRFDPLIPEV
jgi:hypothetical protein